MLRTRFAPTPSGYLHLGNAYSFLLTWIIARKSGGKIHLRIDDYDEGRSREIYIRDIFTSLDWLGLDWDSGPRHSGEFLDHRRRPGGLEPYAAALEVLAERDPDRVYACRCSREQIRQANEKAGRPTGGYPGTCRDLNLEHKPGETALRFRIHAGEQVIVKDMLRGELAFEPALSAGDFILQTKSGEYSYHLASVVDDETLGSNCIVRGEDLMESTSLQLLLAGNLPCPQFSQAQFLHHPLLFRGGEKLSKSEGAPSLSALRKNGLPVSRIYRSFAKSLGMKWTHMETGIKPEDFLASFSLKDVSLQPMRWEDLENDIR